MLTEDIKNDTVYIVPLSTVCLMCKFPNSSPSGDTNVTWTLDNEGVRPSEGEILDDGTLIIRDTSLVFDSKKSTSLVCYSKESSSFTLLLGSKFIHLQNEV